ncbi:hypothetical protein NEOLEDRAFT_1166994 [Neolentinus lepideus HHB14362 ss-1]|uniref:F-box domain-containing protein n=1 Tax=Neolentinus lepideus HHB14362 ss-1 TaxID=1314782 RepID=A0A165VEF6_9AGAM|nr:hypothetical protein NEOLEDRAFT_1166994 [Neolentinus lepideus HHB14362 ss-1]
MGRISPNTLELDLVQRDMDIVDATKPAQNIPALPIELHQEILDHIERRRDLCSLSRVSRALQPVAETLLYRTVDCDHFLPTTMETIQAVVDPDPRTEATQPIPQLPIEIYQEIIGHITSKSDLLSLSLISRAVQALAEIYIYRTIESRRRSRTEAFCQLVVRRPRIGPFVRSLTIANDERHTSYPARVPQFWDTIARALRRMPQLEVLRVHDGFMNPNARILERCTFSLRELSCDFAFNDDFVAFLDTQPRLTSIDWADNDNSARARNYFTNFSVKSPFPGSLPELRMLHTDSVGMAMTLVPGRPVTHLWVSNEAKAAVEEFITAMGSSTGPLLSLRMGFPFHKALIVQYLLALGEYAPGIRSLGFLRPFTSNDLEIVNALAAFKDLHTLVLWSTVTSETLRSLEYACPSLKTVACLHYSYAYEYVRMPVNPIGTPQPMHDPELRLWKDV